MTPSKSLPDRPSLDSLRKQAKKLARDTAAGDVAALARVHAQVPNIGMPLSQRNAQLVVAREYGYAGWQDLVAEVSRRLGAGVDWAATLARRVIHDNDVERLKQLLAEYPGLLSWQGEGDSRNGLLGFATSSFGDSFDPVSEQHFTRAACAELLIDAGAVVTPAVCDSLVDARARGLLQLFQRKGLLPRTPKFAAALGDLAAMRALIEDNRSDLAAITEAFVSACRFEHEAMALLLVDRMIALDLELGRQVDGDGGRLAFVKSFIGTRPAHALAVGPWNAVVMERVKRTVLDNDLTAFVTHLRRDPSLLDDAHVSFQREIVEAATLNNREAFIAAVLDLDPALLRRQPPPRSQAIEFAFTYAHPHLIPLVTRIWPLPDDLPHAAGIGNLPRVKQWFDATGAPALGDLSAHFPGSDAHARECLQWGAPTVQHVLDTALAWSVVNNQFAVADFLLAHGANINTTWSSHEPASILHELVFHRNYEAMRFLIDRGIDMTTKDYRWNATAEGWARYAQKDEEMAQWLAGAERERDQSAQ